MVEVDTSVERDFAMIEARLRRILEPHAATMTVPATGRGGDHDGAGDGPGGVLPRMARTDLDRTRDALGSC